MSDINWIVVSVIGGLVVFLVGFWFLTMRVLKDFEKQWNDGQWRR
jgi:hypothetical protein